MLFLSFLARARESANRRERVEEKGFLFLDGKEKVSDVLGSRKIERERK